MPRKRFGRKNLSEEKKVNDNPIDEPTLQDDHLPEHDGNEEGPVPETCPEQLPNFAYGCHTRPVAIFSKAGPFVFTSMVTWPIFWLWRGLDWRNKQPTDVLPFYIRNTYIQAKIIQIGLIAMGIAASLDLLQFKRKSKIIKMDEPIISSEENEQPVNVKLKHYS